LIRALETLDSTNRYTVFHSRKSDESLVQRFPRSDLWTPCHHRLEPVTLTAELARFNLDLLHSPDFIPPLRGARHHIVTVHDLNFLYYPQFLTTESRRYYNGQIQRAVQQADHILADSAATRNDLIEKLNVPADKITVHMLGVDERFEPLSAEAVEPCRQQLDLPPEYLLFLGTFEPRKNIIGLLEAYRLLLEDLPDAPPIVLAGRQGWLFDETMRRIDDMQLGDRVLWRQDVPQEAMPALYNLADALVTPSFYEGFGFPALEAMACGTVPVVSDRASLPEVVGTVGLLIDPDDPASIAAALRRVLDDSAWRTQMSQAGIARAAEFTWERTARTVLSVYNTYVH
jgi:glycosyltransferase involved in cell wall biosynthesis